MNLGRLLRHTFITGRYAHRRFPAHVLTAIEHEVAAAEKQHSGEIRFAIETALEGPALWRNVSPRQRAHEVFGLLRVWDTERNNGVLIYLLLADRDVEIVADRGFDSLVTNEEWEQVCRQMEEEFRAGRFKEGALAGIRATGELIARHFPPRERDVNELPDRPVIL